MTKDAKLFTLAGTSTVQGVKTFRVANGKPSVRVGILRRAGQTDINLTELPYPMTRADAIAFLQTQGIEALVPAKRKLAKELERITTSKAQAKRERDNERKRAARAAAKLKKADAVQAEVGVDADRELAGMADTGD